MEQTFKEWVHKQDIVFYKRGNLSLTLNYNGVRCMGLLTKQGIKGKMRTTSIQIRPIQSTHDIGNGAGMSVLIKFKDK